MSYAIDKNTIQPLAQNHWTSILPAFGVPNSYLNRRHGPCPICNTQKKWFRFDDKRGDGTFICNACGAGDGFTLLRKVNGWTFPQALEAVANYLGYDHKAPPRNFTPRAVQPLVPEVNEQAYQDILDLWQSGSSIQETDPAGKYLLKARGLKLDSFPNCLRFVPALKLNPRLEFSRTSPAMLAAFTDPSGELVQVERFFLTWDGQKSPIEKPKRFMLGWKEGAMTGGSIKLYPPGEMLAIGEGVETCLAFYSRFKIPVWAAASTAFMEKIVLPEMVRKVLILVDNDESGAGEKSANVLAKRLLKEGREIQLLVPNQPGTDFADLFTNR